MTKRVLLKAYAVAANGKTRPDRVELDFMPVRLLVESGVVSVGDRVTVKVKVGKKKRLYKATLCAMVDRCCGDCDRRGAVFGYYAER